MLFYKIKHLLPHDVGILDTVDTVLLFYLVLCRGVDTTLPQTVIFEPFRDKRKKLNNSLPYE